MEAVKINEGPVGSKIKLTIRRKGEKNIEKTIKREIIQIKSVEAEILKKIGLFKTKIF